MALGTSSTRSATAVAALVLCTRRIRHVTARCAGIRCAISRHSIIWYVITVAEPVLRWCSLQAACVERARRPSHVGWWRRRCCRPGIGPGFIRWVGRACRNARVAATVGIDAMLVAEKRRPVRPEPPSPPPPFTIPHANAPCASYPGTSGEGAGGRTDGNSVAVESRGTKLALIVARSMPFGSSPPSVGGNAFLQFDLEIFGSSPSVGGTGFLQLDAETLGSRASVWGTGFLQLDSEPSASHCARKKS